MKLSLKKFVLEIFKILTLFVNTLSADDKYSLLNRDKLTQPNSDTIVSETNFIFFHFSLYM